MVLSPVFEIESLSVLKSLTLLQYSVSDHSCNMAKMLQNFLDTTLFQLLRFEVSGSCLVI
jgi:hypothetical protein